jgi:hypothetical protein
MSSKPKRAVVGIYIDPDFYPPTINAILNLAEQFQEVIVISRNNTPGDYAYPSNVHLKKIGKSCSVREMEKQPVWIKVGSFLNFLFCLLHYTRSSKTSLVVLYDSIALYGFYLVKNLSKYTHKKIWYHNHDMPDKVLRNQFSVGGLAAKYEATGMKFIDFFSLPSKDRLDSYPEIKSGITVFIIPNYPSLKVYNSQPATKKEDGVIRIIFQGFIGLGLCLEKFIELLPEKINGKTLQLILKGSVKEEYKTFLNGFAEKLSVTGKLSWIPIGPYFELIEVTSSCDIGIGINMNTDTISKTLGTASNKIYEYAASGLPVILFDNTQYRKYLDKYEWAFFTDGSLNSLKENIELISKNLPHLAKEARLDFEQDLNFETNFQPALQKVIAFEK